MTAAKSPITFTKVKNSTAQNVLFRGERLGVITPNGRGGWTGTHRDGTPAPSAFTKIDTAWAMVNS